MNNSQIMLLLFHPIKGYVVHVLYQIYQIVSFRALQLAKEFNIE